MPIDFEHRMIWWKEVLIFGIFYSVYTLIRNQFGSTLVEGLSVPNHAFTNAIRVIRFERWIGLYHEETLQDWVLPHIWLIKTMNVFYGTAHFLSRSVFSSRCTNFDQVFLVNGETHSPL